MTGAIIYLIIGFIIGAVIGNDKSRTKLIELIKNMQQKQSAKKSNDSEHNEYLRLKKKYEERKPTKINLGE